MIYLFNGIISNANEQAIATNNSMDETHKYKFELKPEVRALKV